MNDFMALLMARQNERELAVALERRRLLHESKGADPRFRRNPSWWQRLRGRFHRGLPASRGQASARAGSPAPGTAMHSNA